MWAKSWVSVAELVDLMQFRWRDTRLEVGRSECPWRMENNWQSFNAFLLAARGKHLWRLHFFALGQRIQISWSYFFLGCILDTSHQYYLPKNKKTGWHALPESIWTPLDTSDIDQMQVHPDLCPPELLCSEEEILELLQALDTNKASGPDCIAARMLKSTASVIAPSPKTLFNYSVMNGVVPDELKNSKYIVPIPKSSNRAQASNYRPISLLSILSKILEKHFYNLIFTRVELFCPLFPNQWGFLPW